LSLSDVSPCFTRAQLCSRFPFALKNHLQFRPMTKPYFITIAIVSLLALHGCANEPSEAEIQRVEELEAALAEQKAAAADQAERAASLEEAKRLAEEAAAKAAEAEAARLEELAAQVESDKAEKARLQSLVSQLNSQTESI